MQAEEIRHIIRSHVTGLLNENIHWGKPSFDIVDTYSDGRPKIIRYTTGAGHNVTRVLTYETTEKKYSREVYIVQGHYPCNINGNEIRLKREFNTIGEAKEYFKKITCEYPLSQMIMSKYIIEEMLIYQ